MMGVAGAGAMLAGKMASDNIDFLQQNSTITAAVKIVGGAFIASTQKSDIFKGAGIGLVADGAFSLISQFTSGAGGGSLLGKGTNARVASLPYGHYAPQQIQSVPRRARMVI